MKGLDTLLDRAKNVHDVHQGICDAYPGALSHFRGMTPMPTSPVATTAACLRDACERDPSLPRDNGRPIRVLIAGAQVPETLENGRLWALLGALAGVERDIEVFLVGPEVDEVKSMRTNSGESIPEGLFRDVARCELRTYAGSSGEFFDSGVDPSFDLCCAYSPGFVNFGGSWLLSGDIKRTFEASQHVYVSANPGTDAVADRALLHAMGCQIGSAPIQDFSLELGQWPDENAQWLCHEVYRVERQGAIRTLSEAEIQKLIAGIAMPFTVALESDEYDDVPPCFAPTRSVQEGCDYYSLNHWFAAVWQGDKFAFVRTLGGDNFAPLVVTSGVPRTAITTAAGCWHILELLSAELETSEFADEVLEQIMGEWAVGMDRSP